MSHKKPILRTCGSCEWIFKMVDNDPTCPKCEFGSYGAKYVYGNRAYRYAKTQHPWKQKKMFSYDCKLDKEIMQSDSTLINSTRKTNT